MVGGEGYRLRRAGSKDMHFSKPGLITCAIGSSLRTPCNTPPDLSGLTYLWFLRIWTTSDIEHRELKENQQKY